MKLVNAIDHLLLIDEEAEIKRGDYLLEKENIINIFPDYLTDLDECDKIIAYHPLTKEAKELDLPLLPKPFEEVDKSVELANNYVNKEYKDYAFKDLLVDIFLEGYKAAQSKGQ